MEPVRQQVPVALQALGDLDHRLEAAFLGLLAPRVEELHGPAALRVGPELLKDLAEQPGLHALEVVLDELIQLRGLRSRQILRPLEQSPPRVLEANLP